MPDLNFEDTIAAVATPPGEGGIAVIRVSGAQAIPLVETFFRPSKEENLLHQPTHTIHHGYFVDEKKEAVDEVLVNLFRSPHSFTGEDVVEINCHGGMRVTRRILEILIRAGARPAEPGEFTKRSFLKGKIDLAQAEAVLDLIRARSEASLETALRQLQGKLSERIRQLKEALLQISAHLEASLDFPDERLDVFPREECLKKMEKVQDEIQSLIGSFRRGLALREGILTVIVGRPNVGKSSLLNALLERERALVSSLPGTTRDALEEPLEIAGLPIRLVDTAGLSLSTGSELDHLGMEKTRSYFQEGQLFLFVTDGSSEWSLEDEAVLSEIRGKFFLVVINKSDLPFKWNGKEIENLGEEKPCFVSCRTGKGLPDLERRLEEKLIQSEMVSESLTLTRLRHKLALEKSLELLTESRKTLEKKESAEFVLVDLKAAIDSLRELVGEIYSEDLLDVIFQEFCIGK